jgi:predicted nucleic acid-binding Zn ribbon protein
MASIRLPDHSHCTFCGDPIPFGEKFCSEECVAKEKERVAAERKKDFIFYGVAAATIIILFVIRALTKRSSWPHCAP